MGELEKVSKEVEFEDGTSYEVTHSGDVTETTSTYDRFFNALRENDFKVESDTISQRTAFIGGEGKQIINGISVTLEDVAEEFGLEIEKLWLSNSGDKTDLPLFIKMGEMESGEPKESFSDYLRRNIFISGGYIIDVEDDVAYVAEHDDGTGYMMHSDKSLLRKNENVEIINDTVSGDGMFKGWLTLKDDR